MVLKNWPSTSFNFSEKKNQIIAQEKA